MRKKTIIGIKKFIGIAAAIAIIALFIWYLTAAEIEGASPNPEFGPSPPAGMRNTPPVMQNTALPIGMQNTALPIGMQSASASAPYSFGQRSTVLLPTAQPPQVQKPSAQPPQVQQSTAPPPLGATTSAQPGAKGTIYKCRSNKDKSITMKSTSAKCPTGYTLIK